MTYILDIGSTTFKLKDTHNQAFWHLDRSNMSDIVGELKDWFGELGIDIDRRFLVSSSANGGLRVCIFSLSKSISGLVGQDAITRAGANIVEQFTWQDSFDRLDRVDWPSIDLVVFIGGLSEYENPWCINWANRAYARCNQYFKADMNVISCIYDPNGRLSRGMHNIGGVVNSRLAPECEHLVKYASELYLGNLVDRKNIAGVKKLLKCEIRPTPEVVFNGYKRVTLGDAIEAQGPIGSIWLDIGGATTDIYYPRVSKEQQDGINISTNSISRFVLVAVGFKHSKLSTVKLAKSSYWYEELVSCYTEDLILETRIEEYLSCDLGWLVTLCTFIALVNACSENDCSFTYPLDMTRINTVVLTGGGAILLDINHRHYLQKWLSKRLGSGFRVCYDFNYTLWCAGHD